MWFKRTRNRPCPDAEATAAVEAANESLDAAVRQGDEISRVVEELRGHRMRNHFGERIEAAMRKV